VNGVRRRLRLSAPYLAGWLFADLLLMLFLVSLSLPKTEANPTPNPTQTPPHIQVLSQDYCELKVVVDLYRVQAGDRSARKALLNGLDKALSGDSPQSIVNTDVHGRPDAQGQSRCRRFLKTAGKTRLKAGVIIVSGADDQAKMVDAISAAAATAEFVIGQQGVPSFQDARILAKWTGKFSGGEGLKFIVFFYEP
jgi:hypothetical protein